MSRQQEGYGMFLPDNVKTAKEIVSECGYIPYKSLNNSTTTRRAKRVQKKGGPPPKPPNSYIIFSSIETNRPEYKGMQAKIRSKLIAEKWHNLPKEVKDNYDAGARVAKEIHAKKYGIRNVLEEDIILDLPSQLKKNLLKNNVNPSM